MQEAAAQFKSLADAWCDTPQVAMWHSIETTAPMLGLKVTPADAPSSEDIQRAIESSSHEPNSGLVVFGGPVATLNRSLIVSLITKYRIPAVYSLRFYVESGGMASYGVNLNNQARDAASYFSRILKGEKIVNLPIQQPTSFELVVNLKAAKEVGIKIPESVLSRADEVVE